jgi:DNA-binding NarL/FixJ family response regulator
VQAIVGRKVELEAVERLLDTISVTPRALVIAGEAGIGKTTVWQEAVAAASARGYRVLRARPAESEAELSYAALADLVGQAFDERRAELPEPQQQGLDSALLRVEGPDADARTIATAFVTILASLAREGPTIVAVDDVQWLDRASERVLEFAARRLPNRVGLLVTLRTEDSFEVPLSLDHALPDEHRETVVLGPLSLAGLHHLLRSRLGTAPARPTLARLATASAGNPFFALEIARALERDSGDRVLADPMPVPERLRDLVAARLAALSPPAQDCVVVASALSRPTLATLAAAVGEDVSRSALIETEDAGILVSEHESIRFSHPLIASSVYASLSPQRRRDLHRRLSAVESDPEARARHLARSATEPDEGIAVEIERAAERAARRGAQHAAAELYEASLRLTPTDRASERARRILGEASALLAAGDVSRARDLAERTVALVRHGRLRVQAFLLLAQVAWIDATAETATEYLEQALGDAGDDAALRGLLHAKLATYHMRPAGVLRHADAAIALLDEEEHPGLLAEVLIQKFFSEAVAGMGARRELLERGLALEAKDERGADKSVLPLTWFRAMDEFDAARARYRYEERWYRERGQDGWRAQRLTFLAEAELRAGDWERAERYIEEGCSVLEQVATRGAWSVPLRIRASIDAHRGRLERARATLLRLIEETERANDLFWAAPALSALAFVELSAGDCHAADAAATRMRAHIDAMGIKDHVTGDRSQPDHIEALVTLGEAARARRVLEHLEWRGRTLPRLWIDATLPRARALVLEGEGDTAAAVALLEATPEIPDLPFELARTLLVKGRLHRRSKQKRLAADSFRRASELFERVGAPTWGEQASRELARVGLRRAPGGELTETERRVAELAAAGRRNREIAQALFMSTRTVEANLVRVYRKLGISSRAELGARMGRRA